MADARCQLHGHNIVDRFPRHCPLGEANPADGLLRHKDWAWGVNPTDPNTVHRLRRFDTCDQCVGILLTHPTVQRLRDRFKVRLHG
jgi:hypothetical protein